MLVAIPLCDLNTLILEENLSTFNTLTISVPIPTLNLSFSRILVTSPEIDINVTTPVAAAVPIPCDKTYLSDLIPIAYEPCREVVVVDKDPTLTTVAVSTVFFLILYYFFLV